MIWLTFITIFLVLSSIFMSFCKSSAEKHNLERRLVILETKMAILLEERK